jgi:hypothetical protein
MKAGALKPTTVTPTKPLTRTPPAARAAFFMPARRPAGVQAKMNVNQPGDKLEREADRMADKVMRQPAAAPVAEKKEERLPPKAEGGAVLQRKEGGAPPNVDSATQSGIQSKLTGGQPLAGDVRAFMEPRFDADFSAVRVHHDAEAGALSNRLSARAFTYQNHIFFSRNQYQPGTSDGRHLLAHELTHTIQQGHSIQRSPEVTVGSTTPAVQRLGIQDALDYFADKAHWIPGFRLLTIVLGFNPINGRSVSRSAANILRGLVELIPGGALIAQALENHGVFARAGAWVEEQLGVLGDIGSQITNGLSRFLDSLSWTDIFDLGGVWDRGKAIFTGVIDSLISFGSNVVSGLMAIVREVILRPLARLAEGTPAYDLLKAVLGQDPITGDPVPRSPEILIGGFMKLIGQEEVWQNIQKGNALGRAWAWFQGALSGLMAFVTAIPGQIVATIQSITWQDVVTITGVFTKVGRAFLNVAGQFFSWAGAQVIMLLEIIFSVVAPGAVPYVKKAAGAFRTIIQNPIGFVGNLVRAGKLGFQMFASNIGEHLKTALIKWITGPLGEAGVYIPKSFTLIEIVKLVLSVLGLTWQNIRSKLVKIIPEPVLVVMEKTAGILVTLVKDGPAAAWQEIKNELNELKDSLISQVIQMVTTEIVKAAVVKLVMMLNPAGAVIQAILAIYNTITFFIQKINQIAAVVASFIDSISAIAAGQVGGAAKRVEQTMANTLTIIIAFLAKFAGLGNIPNKLVGVVKKIRAPIDKGLDKIVAWLGGLLKKIGAAAREGLQRFLQWWKKKVPVRGGDESHTLTFEGESSSARLVLRSEPMKPSVFLDQAGEKKNISPAKRKTPVSDAKTYETAIGKLQVELRKYDNKDSGAAVKGTAAKEADGLSKDMDKQLEGLAKHVGTTLEEWQVSDPIVKSGKITLPRGSFSFEQKVAVAEAFPESAKANKAGDVINLRHRGQKRLARRHVVSSHDMATHYVQVLTNKKVSEGKLLLEQRSSIVKAQSPVASLTIPALQAAATNRYDAFFGYVRNLFVGDSRENSAIQENIDPHHPRMQAPGALDAHVRHVKRAWALNDSIKISGLNQS